MAHIMPLEDWKPYRWFPWIERRMVGLFLDSAPGVPIDSSAFWMQRRWVRNRSTAAPEATRQEDEIMHTHRDESGVERSGLSFYGEKE